MLLQVFIIFSWLTEMLLKVNILLLNIEEIYAVITIILSIEGIWVSEIC